MSNLPHPPGPKPINPFENLFRFRKDSLAFLKDISQRFGDISQFKMGNMKVVYVNHPTYIKEVLSNQHTNFVKGRPLKMAKELLGEGLLTSEGDFHKKHSRIIQPAFHRKMMEHYSPAMTEYCSKLMDGWTDGMEVDMMKEMIKMSTGIAGKTLFNVDLQKEASEINDALDVVMRVFGRITLPLSEWLIKVPLPGTIRFFKAKSKLDKLIYRIIDDRKKNPLENGDLLSLLLESQKTPELGVTDEEIRDEALTLLLTAFDTTSLALTWTFYLISQHPKIEEDLQKELDQVLQGRMPTYQDYPKLKFTRMVFSEAMRLYPPIYLIARQALEDFTLDKYKISSGSIVLISPYLIHRDSRFFENPNVFNPWNWEDKIEGPQKKYEYFPFSEGPRSCIGQQYAWLEGIQVLAAISQKWRIRLVSNEPVEIVQLINLRPKNGIQMKVYKRNLNK